MDLFRCRAKRVGKAFGFTIPDGCAPVYVSKAKPVTRRRGRPANPKVENQEL